MRNYVSLSFSLSLSHSLHLEWKNSVLQIKAEQDVFFYAGLYIEEQQLGQKLYFSEISVEMLPLMELPAGSVKQTALQELSLLTGSAACSCDCEPVRQCDSHQQQFRC